MSGFSQVANQLLRTQLQPAAKRGESVSERLDHIEIMSKNGFSAEHVFRDLRELYDECEADDRSLKFQISKLMIQVHGMLSSDEQARAAPTFILNIQGDNAKINTMLCPGR